MLGARRRVHAPVAATDEVPAAPGSAAFDWLVGVAWRAVRRVVGVGLGLRVGTGLVGVGIGIGVATDTRVACRFVGAPDETSDRAGEENEK